MSVCGRSFASARHWTACWRKNPWRGRFRSQSAWVGRNGCVWKTTSRASTPRRRSACTFVQPTPARLTGQWVTRRAIGPEVLSARREQELHTVPARDLAAVCAAEGCLEILAGDSTYDGSDLRAAVDLRTGNVAWNRRECADRQVEELPTGKSGR